MLSPARCTLVAAVLALAGCGSSRANPQRSTAPVAAAPPTAPVRSTPPAGSVDRDAGPPAATGTAAADAGAAAASARVLARGSGDLDGDGQAEEFTLASDGTVTAGARRGRVELAIDDEPFIREHAALQLVTVDRARNVRGVLVTVPSMGDEDPPDRYDLLVPSAAPTELRPALTLTSRARGADALRVAGDGTARYVEDNGDACGRADRHAGRVARHEVLFRLGDDGVMHEARRRATGRMASCAAVAACPFVDVLDAAGRATRVGEILRDLRGAAAYTLQSLELPRAGASTLRVRLAEEKPEVTRLDEIYLVLDGARISPRACAASTPPAYCAADRRMHVMRTGDVLEVEFDVPASTARPELFARGYYDPTPTAHGASPR